MADTYEVVVFDGVTWFRGPVKYDERGEAERAAQRIRCAPTQVMSTRELTSGTLPAPPERR